MNPILIVVFQVRRNLRIWELTLPKSDKSINKVYTREQLAKLAGVSHDTYDKGRKILNSDNGD